MGKIKAKRKLAVITGISLLLMAAIAGLGYGYAFNEAFNALQNDRVAIDPVAINRLLKTTLVSFIVILLLDVVVAWSLYALFKSCQPVLSWLSSFLRIVYTIILGIALSWLLFALDKPLKTQPGINEVLQLLNRFLNSWSFALIVFGLHLIVLAVVLYKTHLVPRLVSHLALFAGLCYLISNGLNHTIPAYKIHKETVEMILALPMAAGELGLALWLLFKRKQFSDGKNT